MEAETRLMLKRISDQLCEADIQNLKYLSTEIPAGELEKLKTGRDLFDFMLRRRMIGPGNLGSLEDLLKRIHREDLARQIRMSGNDTSLQAESAMQSFSAMSVSDKKFKAFLHQLSEALTRDNVESMLFLLDFPGAVRERIRNGKDMFLELSSRQDIAPNNLGLLIEMFDNIYRMDLTEKVKKYQQEIGGLGPSIVMPQRQQSNSRRQPTGHTEGQVSQPPPVTPSIPLLRPGDFKAKSPLPATGIPVDSRYPVQVRDALPPRLDQVDEMPAYRMDRIPRGIALIINNKDFGDNIYDLKERKGTEKDVENLEHLWTNLNFIVAVRNNLKAHQIYDVVRDFSLKDHSDYDCFVCCLLSHGANGGIYGIDSELVYLNQITAQLTGIACPTLAGKPKLFFIQACRGRDFDPGASLQQDAVQSSVEDAMRHSAEPNESHFLLGYATPPGYVSWRSQIHGSWYISKLHEVILKYSQKEDLMSMMVKVNQEVSEAFTKQGYKQCPAPVVTLTKKIFLTKLE